MHGFGLIRGLIVNKHASTCNRGLCSILLSSVCVVFMTEPTWAHFSWVPTQIKAYPLTMDFFFFRKKVHECSSHIPCFKLSCFAASGKQFKFFRHPSHCRQAGVGCVDHSQCGGACGRCEAAGGHAYGPARPVIHVEIGHFATLSQ